MIKVGLDTVSPQVTNQFAVQHVLKTRCCSFSGGIYSQEKRESATEYRLSVDPLSGNLNQVASTSADLHIQCIKIEGPR